MFEPVQRHWYRDAPPPLWARALSLLYAGGAATARIWQRHEAARVQLPIPVIVAGNLTAGGAGKTPLVLWLVERLREWGWKPGVVSRGYGGRMQVIPYRVSADSDAEDCGDEPLLIQRRLACPVFVCADRVAAVQALAASGEADVAVSDDGLQHYRLPRQFEFAVVDGQRGLGNGCRLPAGPLREPASRLSAVDAIVVNGGSWRPPVATAAPVLAMRLSGGRACALDGSGERDLDTFIGHTVHAVAGIGNPARFFSMLTQAGLRLVMHPFPDHYRFRAPDLDFGDGHPVLMTEKDAVKCGGFVRAGLWSVPVTAEFAATDVARVRESLEALRRRFHG